MITQAINFVQSICYFRSVAGFLLEKSGCWSARSYRELAGLTRAWRSIGARESRSLRDMVRAVGLEPTLLAEPDFESGASTNFTTPA